MPRKKTEVRVKRTEAMKDRAKFPQSEVYAYVEQLESRLKAAEAECRRLRKENAALKAEQDGRRHRQCFNCGRSPASAMDD